MRPIFFLVPAMLALGACVEATMAWTDLSPKGAPAEPALIASSLEEWETVGAPGAHEALQSSVYGIFPDVAESGIISHKVVNGDAFGGRGIVEEYRLSAATAFGAVRVETRENDGAPGFVMNVVLPKSAEGPSPVIMMETFCPRWDTVPDPAVAGAPAERKSSLPERIATYVFGRYICTPPIEAILDAGFAIAAIFPGDIVPDRSAEGLAELKRLSSGHADDETRWGAIAAWAFGYSRMVDALEQDGRLDRNGMIAWGHSRYAKAALLAAAFDERIDGVIAHQSGTGGASLNRDKRGESVKAITDRYPHWFARAYRGFAGREREMPVDQHALLALIAPRPILLGNARRDVWSDPNGAFRAAMAADAVYELYGVKGLDQERLDAFLPDADIAFWIRPGTHGVVKEDWPAFLDFLNAHFGDKEQDRGGGIVSSGR
jgi:hypothetical protein